MEERISMAPLAAPGSLMGRPVRTKLAAAHGRVEKVNGVFMELKSRLPFPLLAMVI